MSYTVCDFCGGRAEFSTAYNGGVRVYRCRNVFCRHRTQVGDDSYLRDDAGVLPGMVLVQERLKRADKRRARVRR